MKRRIAKTGLALLAILTVFALAGCGRNATVARGPTRVNPVKGALPLVEERTAISAFMAESGGGNFVSSYTYADNEFTRRVTRETNIEFDWIIGGPATNREQLNILLNAGNYPELIITPNIGYNEMVFYANQGIFIPLDEFDPLSYPRIKAAFEEFPAINEIVRSSDGLMYSLPSVNDCLHCMFEGGRMWIYWPWISKAGRKMPETLDEFTDYLRWVRDTDLNGNGVNDEIPLAFEGRRHVDNFVAAFAKPFMPFVVSRSYWGIAIDNGRVVEQYKDPRFRDALKYMVGLYSEGLILPESFTLNQDQMRSIMSAEVPILGVSASPWPNNHTDLPSQRLFEYFEIRALQGPGGRNANNVDPWSVMGPRYFITDKARDPELLVALYDYFIRFDVSVDSYYGPKGIAWEDAAPGTTSILNLPAVLRTFVTYGSQALNTTWDQAAPMIRNRTFRGGEEAFDVPLMIDYIQNRNISLIPTLLNNTAFTNEGFWYMTAYENTPFAMPNSLFIPPIAFNDNDSTRIADINAVLLDFNRSAMVQFITGGRNINSDADWNTYLAELDRIGSADLTSIIQSYLK